MDTGTALTVSMPLILAFFTWLTRRGLDRKSAESQEQSARLTQQREDFLAVIGPLQAQLERTSSHVDSLEKRTAQAEKNTRIVGRALRSSLRYFQDKYDDPGPDLDPRVNSIIEGDIWL